MSFYRILSYFVVFYRILSYFIVFYCIIGGGEEAQARGAQAAGRAVLR
jgi:hypothetical protein